MNSITTNKGHYIIFHCEDGSILISPGNLKFIEGTPDFNIWLKSVLAEGVISIT